jgi:HAD superfamily hydrolase (TIGR01509 family)
VDGSVNEDGWTAPIAALIFDMDGLLVDSETASAGALALFLAEYERVLDPGTLERTLGRRLPEAIAAVAELHQLPGPVAELIARYDAMRLQALRGAVTAMLGAGELLRWARDHGLKVALATSSFRRHADVALAEAGLTGLFDAEVTGEEVEAGKPAPDLFLLAAARLGVAPAACIVFEDAPAGLEAAARAGMRRVWVPNAHTRHLVPPVPVQKTLASLHDAVPWLGSQSVARSQLAP